MFYDNIPDLPKTNNPTDQNWSYLNTLLPFRPYSKVAKFYSDSLAGLSAAPSLPGLTDHLSSIDQTLDRAQKLLSFHPYSQRAGFNADTPAASLFTNPTGSANIPIETALPQWQPSDTHFSLRKDKISFLLSGTSPLTSHFNTDLFNNAESHSDSWSLNDLKSTLPPVEYFFNTDTLHPTNSTVTQVQQFSKDHPILMGALQPPHSFTGILAKYAAPLIAEQWDNLSPDQQQQAISLGIDLGLIIGSRLPIASLQYPCQIGLISRKLLPKTQELPLLIKTVETVLSYKSPQTLALPRSITNTPLQTKGKLLNLIRDPKTNKFRVEHTQKHHLFPQTERDHPVFDFLRKEKIEFNFDGYKNIMILPTKIGAQHSTTLRTIHQGRHTDDYVKKRIKILDNIGEKINRGEWKKDRVLQELEKDLRNHREELKSGDVKLNKNHREWAKD